MPFPCRLLLLLSLAACSEDLVVGVCGDGRLDPGETCDPGLIDGPGDCSARCEDNDPCTIDVVVGRGCGRHCEHVPVTAGPAVPDQCCPPGASKLTDVDCDAACGDGVLAREELCDIGIVAGLGACPTNCDDGQACTIDYLGGVGCDAVCNHTAVTPGATDGCCLSGGPIDPDCSPTCGNGTREGIETCDILIPTGSDGACPATSACDDANPCTLDSVTSPGTCADTCVHASITAPVGGDGCCPAPANANNDTDCSPACGNGAVETGETCDSSIAAPTPGACPASLADCDDGDACTADNLVGASCEAQCTHALVAVGPWVADGCCPMSANRNTDADCAPVCGNGAIEPGEACDTAIIQWLPGWCPWPAEYCNDANPCTTDVVVGSGCSRVCAHVSAPLGEGCIPQLEAARYVQRIADGAQRYYDENGSVPASVGTTPVMGVCCASAGQVCVPDPAQFSGAWDDLRFEPTEPHRYMYSFQQNPASFTARAVGDLDCNGVYSTFEITGTYSGSTVILSPLQVFAEEE